MYMSSFTNPQNGQSMGVCLIRWSGWPQNVATTTYPSSLECLVQVLRNISVIVGRDSILFPNHTVYIQLWMKKCSRKSMYTWHVMVVSANKNYLQICVMLTAPKTFTFDCLTYVWQLCADSMISRWLEYDNLPSLRSIITKNKLSFSRWISITVQRSLRHGWSFVWPEWQSLT
jgi:hypothetical protein